jgi:hypothetical protein
VVAVVIRADRTWPGVHPGCSASMRMPEPATWGDDIEVPAMAWKYSPGGPSTIDSGAGVLQKMKAEHTKPSTKKGLRARRDREANEILSHQAEIDKFYKTSPMWDPNWYP